MFLFFVCVGFGLLFLGFCNWWKIFDCFLGVVVCLNLVWYKICVCLYVCFSYWVVWKVVGWGFYSDLFFFSKFFVFCGVWESIGIWFFLYLFWLVGGWRVGKLVFF